MWTEDKPIFEGKHYQIDQPINEPKGVQSPHPPLWIGGSGEQVTLKLVAQWGDACNLFGRDPDTITHKLDVLRKHCDSVGRNYDEITRSAIMSLYIINPGDDPAEAVERVRGPLSTEEFTGWFQVGTPEQLAAHMRSLTAVGINYFIIYLPRLAHNQEQLHRLAEEVMPHVV
jgi:alkanesulfonate monooxygenase SsuD/methylene tetrahydromethanopterin reductase-like flavin-dependent oxidoreductase (luciferase family)